MDRIPPEIRLAQQYLLSADGRQLPEKNLPIPPDSIKSFYAELDFPFTDSKTNKPVKELTNYQYRAITNHLNHKKFLLLKGQKMGISSLFILVTLWHALRDCQTYELVVLAQSKEKAIEHGRDLRRMIAQSSKYSDYLIRKQSDAPPGLLKDEVTKITEIYLQSRDNPGMPTKIHILSPSHTQISSIKRVKYAWLSDITLVRDIAERQQSWFMALASRLVLTEGQIVIECPTVGTLGPIWEIDDRYQKNQKAGIEPGEHEFFVDRLKVDEAIQEGLMSQEAVDALRLEHGPMFGAYFLADWFAGDSTWYNAEDIKDSDAATEFCE